MQIQNKLKQLGLSWLNIGILAIYIVLSIIGILNHEMWRDELQAWMVARDANSFIDLFRNLKYEGNPALWHILLFLLTRITDSPYSIQILHLAISFSFVFIFITKSSFNSLNKFLFISGYFILFEYNIISRGYGLGVLLLFLAIYLLKNTSKNQLIIFVILALLANTTIYGLILSGSFTFVIITNLFFPNIKKPVLNKKPSRKTTKKIIKQDAYVFQWPQLKSSFYIGITIYLIGAFLSPILLYHQL